jgi:plastocyanin
VRNDTRRRARQALVAPAAALLLASLGAARAAAADATVVIENMRFNPAALTVHAGDKITWQNRDLVPHTATAAGTFDSKVIEPGKSWSYVIKQAGRIEYLCTLHPSMTGALVSK